MTILRNVLRWQAVRWGLVGALLAVAPRAVVAGWLSQRGVFDTFWIRTLGITSIVIAAQMVLVGRKLEELWWWAWSFVVLELATGLLAAAHILTDPPPGSAEWPFVVAAVVSLAFAAVGIVGLATTGTERSPA